VVLIVTLILSPHSFLQYIISDPVYSESFGYKELSSINFTVNRKGYQATNDDEEEKLDPSSNNKIAILSPWRYFWFRILHSILTGLNYGLALLLMLIAMTYNPSLFLALIIGYAFGDFIFFAQMRPSSFSECH
jgi:hypothetical protein